MKSRQEHFSVSTKRKALGAIENGASVAAVAIAYGVTRATIYRWMARASNNNADGLKRVTAPGSGNSPKLTLSQVNRVLRYMQKPASAYNFDSDLWTCSKLRSLISDKIGQTLHRSTIHRMLTEAGQTYKKIEPRWDKADLVLQKDWIENTIPEIKKYARRKNAILYFVDESAISLTSSIGKSWSPRGIPAIVNRASSRGRLSAISAISPGNRLLFSLGRKNFGATEVVKFLNQLMKAHPARVIVVVLDNASSHRSKLVKNFERDNSNLKLYFLPTYSQQWNPDEKVWNHLKSIELIGHKERDLDGLEKLTRKKLSKMARTPKLLRGIFMRCEVAKFFI